MKKRNQTCLSAVSVALLCLLAMSLTVFAACFREELPVLTGDPAPTETPAEEDTLPEALSSPIQTILEDPPSGKEEATAPAPRKPPVEEKEETAPSKREDVEEIPSEAPPHTTPDTSCGNTSSPAPTPFITIKPEGSSPSQPDAICPTSPEASLPANPEPEILTPPSSEDKSPSVEISKPAEHPATPSVSYERRVAELVNEIRLSHGLTPLTFREDLSAVAREKSRDMQEKGYFDHQSPTYGSPFDMMKTFGISYRTAGENIAMGYSTPENVVEAWMNSAGHRANILNPAYTEIGVGYVKDGHVWTQHFIG